MSWLQQHAAELGAIGSIFMNLTTLVIIYFNVHQLKLNSHSLNVDINFKVFEMRKNLYMETLSFIKGLNHDKGLRQHLLELDNGEFESDEQVKQLVGLVDNYKYLFAPEFSAELEFLTFNINTGLQIEMQIAKLKNKDASMWTAEDQNEMHALGHKLKDILSSILEFNSDQFLPYINVSNFYKDLMRDDNHGIDSKIGALSSPIMLAKKGVALLPKLSKQKF